jgi:hypothetical protein
VIPFVINSVLVWSSVHQRNTACMAVFTVDSRHARTHAPLTIHLIALQARTGSYRRMQTHKLGCTNPEGVTSFPFPFFLLVLLCCTSTCMFRTTAFRYRSQHITFLRRTKSKGREGGGGEMAHQDTYSINPCLQLGVMPLSSSCRLPRLPQASSFFN